MPRMIFVNLPVAELPRAIAFYEAMGWQKNPQFSDESGACMVLSETIHAMLLTHAKFAQFTGKPIGDARQSCAVINALSAGSRAEVDEVVGRAAAAGGVADPAPAQDHGFMYGRSFEDPDGHVWELFWMDMEACAAQPG